MGSQEKLTRVLIVVGIVLATAVARPYPDDGQPFDESHEKFEVFVPDGSGQLTQQMMTLKEIRALLARQSLDAEQEYHSDKTEILSLEGGKGVPQSLPTTDPVPREAEVSDVVSSVKTIMAAEMAKLQPENENIFVVMASGDQPTTQGSTTAGNTSAETTVKSAEKSSGEAVPAQTIVERILELSPDSEAVDSLKENQVPVSSPAENVPENDEPTKSVPEQGQIQTYPDQLALENQPEIQKVSVDVPILKEEVPAVEKESEAADEAVTEDESKTKMNKVLGVPHLASANIVGEIPYFKSTVLSASTPSVEGVKETLEPESQQDDFPVTGPVEDVNEDQSTETNNSEVESMETSGSSDGSEVVESTETSLDAEPVTEDPEQIVVEIENNIRLRPVFYQNVLGNGEEHNHDSHHEHHDDHGHHEHHSDHHEHHGDHGNHHEHHGDHHGHHGSATSQVTFDPVPAGNKGLSATNSAQEKELEELSAASNSIAWKVWNNALKERSVESNQVFSPLALTSALGISFLGARGSSADTIDSVLGLDALTTRNPHLHLRQVGHDVESSEYFTTKMDHAVFVDKNRGPMLDIFKARVDILYGAKLVSSTDELSQTVSGMASHSNSRMGAFLNEDSMKLRPPLGILSVASLKANWPVGQIVDSDLQFLNLPSSAQVSSRRLVPVPAVRAKGIYFAGYDAELDATAAALPLYPARANVEELYLGKTADRTAAAALQEAGHLSLILLMPGSTSKFQAGGSGLAALEAKLAQDPESWDKLLKNVVGKPLEVQFPQLSSHGALRLGRSVMAVQTPARSEYGALPTTLAKLFDPDGADFSGVGGPKNLYLVDLNQFVELNISSIATPGDVADRPSVASRSDMTCEKLKEKAALRAQLTAVKTSQAEEERGGKKNPAEVKPNDKLTAKQQPPQSNAAAMTVESIQSKTSADKTKVNRTPQPTANKTLTATKKSTQKTTTKTISKPTDATKRQTAKTTPRPTAKPTSKPTAKTTAKSTTKTKTKPMAKVTSKPTSKPTTKPTIKSIASKSTTKPTIKPTPKPVTSKSTAKPTTKPTPKSAASKFTSKPTIKPTPKSVASKSTAKPTIKPIAKTKVKLTQNPTLKPTSKTTSKPVASKSTTKPTMKPTTKTMVKQTQKPNSKPTFKTTSKPVSTSKKPMRPLTTKPVHNPAKNKFSPKETASGKTASKKSGRADEPEQRLVFNRAFLYAVRHNPTGMIMYIGRYVHP